MACKTRKLNVFKKNDTEKNYLVLSASIPVRALEIFWATKKLPIGVKCPFELSNPLISFWKKNFVVSEEEIFRISLTGLR